ncbi:MAG: TolC family protein, partial [Bdellovibrionales bacterium]|nr:TolC family protein [Bdellovibrionales bacterium]
AETEYEVSVSQPLRLSSFGARSRVASLLEQVSSVEEKLALNELIQKLTLLYGKAWAMQEGHRLAQSAAERSAALHRKVRDAASKGVIPQSVEKLFLAESAKLKIAVSGLEADRKRAFAELLRASGVSLRGWTLERPTLREIDDRPLDAAEEIPLVKRLEMRRKIALEQHSLARLDSFPRFAPRIALEHTEEGDDRIIAGFSVALPFWDRNQSERIERSAALVQSRAEASYYAGGVFQEELSLLHDSYRASLIRAERFSKEVLPVLQSALSTAEDEFEKGQGSALQVWQVLRELADAQETYLETWVRALSEKVELAILLGKDI